MSKYTEKKIVEIINIVEKEIPEAVVKGVTIDEYLNKYRFALNSAIIEAIMGCEFITPKKDGKNTKIRFNHKRANQSETVKIFDIINNFIRNFEADFLKDYQSFNEMDDMSIPTRANDNTPKLEKFSNKKIHEYIFGSEDSASCISRILITPSDIINLTAVAEKIRKHKNRNMMLMIGGIALVVTGIGVGTVVAVKHSHQDDVDVDADLPEIDMDDGPEVNLDMDDDDVPTVEFDED